MNKYGWEIGEKKCPQVERDHVNAHKGIL